MILKRISPKLWIGREIFEELHQHAALVLTTPAPGKWKASLAILTKGSDPTKAPHYKQTGEVHELLAWAQQIIQRDLGRTIPIIKQEVPWSTMQESRG